MLYDSIYVKYPEPIIYRNSKRINSCWRLGVREGREGLLNGHRVSWGYAQRLAHSAKYYKSEKERQMPRDIIRKWNLKYNTNVFIHKKERHTEQISGCQRGEGLGRDRLGVWD